MDLKIKKVIKTVFEWIIYVAVFLVIVWGTPWALTKILKTEYPIAAITSSSMWPALKQGDIVLIRGVSGRTDIEKGDIVVYTNDRGFTIHRAVDLRTDEIVTKGDANNINDAPVGYDRVIGKAVTLRGKPVRIPWLGKLSSRFNR